MKREFLMLAKEWTGQDINGWYASIKYDGQRALWDGGVSRGMPKVNIPWASVGRGSDICTGLWSRYGNVIHAPQWWLDKLPAGVILDGELWMGRCRFQETMSVVRSHTPGVKWREVLFQMLDVVQPHVLFHTGQIKNTTMEKFISEEVCLEWWRKHGGGGVGKVCTFEETVRSWGKYRTEIVRPTEQRVWGGMRMLDEELSLGGEGVVVRDPKSVWTPHRIGKVLKIKGENDGTGTVVGIRAGEGKYRGMLGSLIVAWEGVTFGLSGFTDDERRLYIASSVDEAEKDWAWRNPGELCPAWISCKFALGSAVTFKYREKTTNGEPREARYYRKETLT